MEVIRQLANPSDHTFFVAEVQDVTSLRRLSTTSWCAGGCTTRSTPICATSFATILRNTSGPRGLSLFFFVEWDSSFLGRSANDVKPDLTEDVADAECGFVHVVSFQLCTPTITEWIEVLLNRAGVITRTKRRHRAGARLDRIPPPQISPDRKLQQALLGAMRGCTHGFFRVE